MTAPTIAEINAAANPTAIDNLVPQNRRLNRSRPKWSVPSIASDENGLTNRSAVFVISGSDKFKKGVRRLRITTTLITNKPTIAKRLRVNNDMNVIMFLSADPINFERCLPRY